MFRNLLIALPAVLALSSLAVLPGCATLPSATERPTFEAAATLRDASGRTVGAVYFAQQRSGSLGVEVTVAGISAGTHGIHLHAVGSCEAAGSTPFGAAGGHFNPLAAAHGLHNPRGAHGGDLPNLAVAADGTGRLGAATDRATLTPDVPTSLLDGDGAAVVIHAGADDQVSDPAGNSGTRIACGVIERR
jgi:Cu-Zn family superoxide dismutase